MKEETKKGYEEEKEKEEDDHSEQEKDCGASRAEGNKSRLKEVTIAAGWQ